MSEVEACTLGVFPLNGDVSVSIFSGDARPMSLAVFGREAHHCLWSAGGSSCWLLIFHTSQWKLGQILASWERWLGSILLLTDAQWETDTFDQFFAMFAVRLDVGAVCSVFSAFGGSTRCNFSGSWKQIFLMTNRQKESGSISFLSVLSHIKLSLFRHIRRTTSAISDSTCHPQRL